MLPALRDPLELWGGIECTVNRVRHGFVDQLELSGHEHRVDDIDLIADLGIRTLRYPILWERTSPASAHDLQWRWADERMERMAIRRIRPIVGLVHHGSGPHYTDLLDDRFAPGLAAYAGEVARRYSHIRYVTPVNEPLTTARFAGLYGHWYPHARAHAVFARMVLNQALAIAESFRAMKAIIPDIQLVQTEDMGRVSSSESLAYQAHFENERRWLTFDLLFGRVDEAHSMWKHLAIDEASEGILATLIQHPCPPDLVGVNYYVTSDRFLDERVSLYPESSRGGNGRHVYADTESARVLTDGISGHASILTEAWERYRVPVALTEVHLGCTREHQMRWLLEAWRGASQARSQGCDVRAVTAWALLGSFGWNNLVTRPPFEYECGAFDLRSDSPRETGVARVIRSLAASGNCTLPPAVEPGWWSMDSRLSRPAGCKRPDAAATRRSASKPLLITGAGGTLGFAFARVCRERGIGARGLSRSMLDLSGATAVRDVLGSLRPWAVINTAGYVRVDEAEADSARCYQANTHAVGVLSAECARVGIPLVTFSSDLVFDGRKRSPYVESDSTAPLNTYGASKAAAERRALDASDDALVIRTSAFFGPWDQHNFIATALRSISLGTPFKAASDVIVSPTYVPDLVHAALDLLMDGEKGIWHLANRGEIAWSDLASAAAIRAELPASMIHAVPVSSLRRPARQPVYSALGSERATLLPTLENALDRWLSESSLPERMAATA